MITLYNHLILPLFSTLRIAIYSLVFAFEHMIMEENPLLFYCTRLFEGPCCYWKFLKFHSSF